MPDLVAERIRLHAGFLCWVVMASTAVVVYAAPPIAIEVQETAGIRRFQYPLAVELRLTKPVPRETKFRLARAGAPVAAQIRAGESGATVARWWLDFSVDLLPHESATYAVEYGRDVTEGAGPKRGFRLLSSDDAFRIVNEPHIAWTVPVDLDGLLSSVRAGELEYLRTGATGLLLRDCGGKDHPVGGSKDGRRPSVRVTRQGKQAVGLCFEHVETGPQLAEVRWTVDLTFPVVKSWVEVDWRIEDPRDRVAGVLGVFNAHLDAPTREKPTLIDFGAASLVYVSLGPGQRAQLRGGSAAWQVLRGSPDRLEPFVAGPNPADSRPEGWVHVMDRQRCLAMAVDRFAVDTEDSIGVSAAGRLELSRSFRAGKAVAAAVKRLRFWLHFVPFPPQQTAATSPQAMQNPVVIRVRGEVQ